jgi:hypothetical protein
VSPDINRRDFLKLVGANLAGLMLPGGLPFGDETEESWPELILEDLPVQIRNILSRTPRATIDSTGYLFVRNTNQPPVQVPAAPTQWNLENNKPYHRLAADKPWGIVLHWYGDKENFDHSLKGYLRGFDSLREIEDYMARTSAHFLIGDEPPASRSDQLDDRIGIIQTQNPDQDGTPFLASHLRNLDIEAHQARKQYFVRAYYQLASREPAVHSLLQDMFDGPRADPNYRTIAIEIAGFNFDHPDHYPSDQKIANVLAVVWAIMRRYRIPACNILGHHEIQLGKPDPGKKLMATIRFLLGVKAILEADPQMVTLVFGQFLDGIWDSKKAIEKYFSTMHDYFSLIGSRRSIYEWEISSKYWLAMDAVYRNKNVHLADKLRPPLGAMASLDGKVFVNPYDHEGVDLYVRKNKGSQSLPQAVPVVLVGEGLCLYHGQNCHCGQGIASIFRHRQANGADILSIYEPLSESNALVPGQYYPSGYPLGTIQAMKAYQSPYLHFAIAYGTSWEMDLKTKNHPPLNAGPAWIRERYMEPLAFLADHQA